MGNCWPFRPGRVAAPAPYRPTIRYVRGNIAGIFADTPRGIVLHSTRSGLNRSTEQEWLGTLGYVERGAEGKGWNVTVGPNQVAIHLEPDEWGWHAKGESRLYLAVEFAQGRIDDLISNAQVRAACWWIHEHALVRWPDLPMEFPMHSELVGALGNTDAYPRGDARADELRARVLAGLGGG